VPQGVLELRGPVVLGHAWILLTSERGT
jgi:hypothetical protein